MQLCCNNTDFIYICQICLPFLKCGWHADLRGFFSTNIKSKMKNNFEVIIIGGNYSGLSAAMALGRATRNVLVIDGGKPCNRFTQHSHNFLTQDGETPAAISAKAKAQVMAYPTVSFLDDIATSAKETTGGFSVSTAGGATYTAQKILFATGIKDKLPEIEGFTACWGKSVIHCPYCHGYEYRNEKTAIVANGDAALHYGILLKQWTKDLTVFTNGVADFTDAQIQTLASLNIKIIDLTITGINHEDGMIKEIETTNGNFEATALYHRPSFEQHCDLPNALGCQFNEQGYIITDAMQKTTVPGIYAAGDCTTPMRSVSSAVAQGGMAGAAINAELCMAGVYTLSE